MCSRNKNVEWKRRDYCSNNLFKLTGFIQDAAMVKCTGVVGEWSTCNLVLHKNYLISR